MGHVPGERKAVADHGVRPAGNHWYHCRHRVRRRRLRWRQRAGSCPVTQVDYTCMMYVQQTLGYRTEETCRAKEKEIVTITKSDN